MDDAALINTGGASKLAFTVDFITPIVDDPEHFGAIAAANSISDVYAMGAEPRVALAICGFPEELVPPEILTRILQGGANKAAEAGCAIVGGHTVLDPELKYGLCVIGDVDPDKTLSQTGAKVGDRLVLTKPIGSGIAAQAIKNQKLSPQEMDEVVEAMQALNKGAKDAALAVGSRAATDVTGFGLLGHVHNLVFGSGLSARLNVDAVPTFAATKRLAAEGLIPGGSKNNLRYIEASTRFDDSVTQTERLILADAQTSGGLVIAVKPEREGQLLEELEKHGVAVRAVIGEVADGEAGHISVSR
ncbi:MAG: selenide,water dikinase [Myxococcota bacterium]|jgi:selenide,water dikinase